MDVKELYRLRNLLLAEFVKQCNLAQDEDDLDYLAEVAVECLSALPSRVILVDYYDRPAVKANMPDDMQNTQDVDAVMDRYCPEFNYDSENDYIGELADEIKGGKIDITEI